jgi:uncharacterized membrane protein YccC
MFYLAETLKALTVVRQLQDWLDTTADALQLVAAATISDYSLAIFVGECCVYSSENAGSDEDELTFEYCRQQLREAVDDLVRAISDEDKETELQRLRRLEEVAAEVASMPGKDWLQGQLRLAEALNPTATAVEANDAG